MRNGSAIQYEGRGAWRSVGTVFGVMLLAAACTNPVSIEGHARVDSAAILFGEQVLAVAERTTSEGAIELVAGSDLAPVTIEFRYRGVAVTPTGDYFLEVVSGDANTASFEAASTGAFTGTLRGHATGTTTLRVRLMHGRPGSPRAHPDFDSAQVPVSVSAAD